MGNVQQTAKVNSTQKSSLYANTYHFFSTVLSGKAFLSSGVLFGGHVRLVFSLVLVIFIICVTITLTSFAEIPLRLLEASHTEV